MSEQRSIIKEVRESNPARLGLILLTGIAIGSGLMYLFDQRMGNRRRAVARDKALSLARQSGVVAGKTFRHIRNRLQGALAAATQGVAESGVVSDRKLSDRIRSTIGRVIQTPHAVDLAVHEGRVTLRGVLKPHEAGLIVGAIEKIPGVRSVDNQVVDLSHEAPTMQ
jgi:osmotically-inducible protein OsmY